MIVKVKLAPQDYERAAAVGTSRRIHGKANDLRKRNNYQASDEQKLINDIRGAIGELVVAQYLNLEHHVFAIPERLVGSVDLPPNIDVKCPSAHNRRLIIFLDDDPNKIFVLATCVEKDVWLHGWTYGHQVMKDHFIKDPVGGRPAYFVDSHALQPMQLLKDFVADLGYTK